MPNSLITTVNAWRFERPLAIALAASAIFMVMAVPPAQLPAVPGVQPLLALILGLGLGALGYAAMSYPWPRMPVAAPVRDDDALAEEEQSQFAAAEVSLRLRRADRHPDAPVREPIFASRELGSPFMEVGAAPPPSAAPDAGEATERAIPDGDYAEVDEAPAAAAPEDAEPDQAEHEPEHAAVQHDAEPASPLAGIPAPLAAFAPEDGPAPQPVRGQRESIPAMMDRLSAGLERRAAHGACPPPAQDRQPALREALEELNRLAARRG